MKSAPILLLPTFQTKESAMSPITARSTATITKPTKGVLGMKRLIHSCVIALLAIIVGAPRASAATTLDVNITFTIADIVAVQWNDATTAAKTWALGSVTLNTVYETVTPDGTWGGNLRIANVSSQTNTTVDVDLQIVSAPGGWSDNTVNGADTYVVKAKLAATDTSDLDTNGLVVRSGSVLTDFVNNLANGGTSSEIDLQLQLPSTITTGAGAAQSITLRFTASVAN
jgi:hypothetical protein